MPRVYGKDTYARHEAEGQIKFLEFEMSNMQGGEFFTHMAV